MYYELQPKQMKWERIKSKQKPLKYYTSIDLLHYSFRKTPLRSRIQHCQNHIGRLTACGYLLVINCTEMCAPMPPFENNIIFHLVSWLNYGTQNYCAQRNSQDDMEAGTNRLMWAFNISKPSYVWKWGHFAKDVLYVYTRIH